MGYTTSTVHGIEVPDSAEANNIPEDIGKVVTALEGGSFARRLTGAQIAALTGAQKTAGVLVYNTTTNRLQISDGSAWVDVGAPVWQTWTCTVTASTTNPTGVTQIDCKYTQIGKTVHFRAVVTIPLATKGSGTYQFSLPVSAASNQEVPLGQGHNGTILNTGAVIAQTTTTAILHIADGSGNKSVYSSTHVTGDDASVYLTGTYEAA